MAGGKETPRQKMIGMMYLVLMALLAMNVSKEVLNSFVVINTAIENTNEAFSEKNGQALNQFAKQNGINPAKVGPFYAAAQTVVSESDKLDEYLDKLKKRLVAETEGFPGENGPNDYYETKKANEDIEEGDEWNLMHVGKKDNYDVVTNVMIGSDPGNPVDGENSAKELRAKIEAWKTKLIASVPAKHRETFKKDIGFTFEQVQVAKNEAQDWEAGNFYHVPIAAVVTNLSRYQADLKTAESEALSLLFGEISADDFKFDTLAVKVLPNSNYITLGDSFKADVIVAAVSYTHLRAHETVLDLVCRLLLEKKK